MGDASRIFVLRPTLEGALGIGKVTKDKPKKVVETLSGMALGDFPEPLVLSGDFLIRGDFIEQSSIFYRQEAIVALGGK